jgi:hypothetical protein
MFLDFNAIECRQGIQLQLFSNCKNIYQISPLGDISEARIIRRNVEGRPRSRSSLFGFATFYTILTGLCLALMIIGKLRFDVVNVVMSVCGVWGSGFLWKYFYNAFYSNPLYMSERKSDKKMPKRSTQ